MIRKLDMGQAWEEATALMSRNRDMWPIVAAVFIFLPNAIFAVALPGTTEVEAQIAAAGEDVEQMMQALSGFYGEIWWAIVLVGLLQAVGMLAILALWAHRARPTVADALTFGGKALLPLIAAQLLSTLLVVIVVVLLIALGAAISAAVAGLLGLVGTVLAVYLWVKFSLIAPVVAAEHEFNPIRAMQRSWQVTKGNSLRIFGFFVLLLICAIVISLLASMAGSIFAIAGEQVGLFAGAIVSALVTMALTVVYLAVLLAVYRQLAGANAETVEDVFD